MRAIFMLHGVDDSDSVLSVSAEQLRGLVTAIRAAGHRLLTVGELVADKTASDAIALSFDDGFASVAYRALPVLAEANAPATLYLTTGRVGGDNRWPSQPAGAPAFELVDWDQVGALHEAGWEIGAHSITHPDLRTVTDDALEHELAEPVEVIKGRLGVRPAGFAYPYGYLDERAVEAVRRHHDHAVTTTCARLDGREADPHRLPRVDAYYLRDPRVYRRFGSAAFSAWIALRGALRRLRSHPGETG